MSVFFFCYTRFLSIGRQVGKTTLVTEFAKSYDFFISLNLEKAADKEFFETYDDVKYF